MDETNGIPLFEQFPTIDDSLARQAAHQELDNQLQQQQIIQQQQSQAGPEMYATQGTIQQPTGPGPFQGTYDPNQSSRDMKRAQFMQIGPDGQPQQIANPYVTGQPVQPPPAYIQDPSQMQWGYGQIQDPSQQLGYLSSPYAVQQVQAPQWQNPYSPQEQALSQILSEQSLQKAIDAQRGPSGFKKAIRPFAQAIGPGIAAAFGDRAGAAQLAQQGQYMVRNAQQMDLAKANQAADFLKTAVNIRAVMGYKPMQQMAEQIRKANEFNARAQNQANAKGYQAANQQKMQNQRLNFQAWKYGDQAQRQQLNTEWDQRFKQMGMAVKMDQFDRNMMMKDQIQNDIQEWRKVQAKLQVRGQDQALQAKQADLTNKIQEQIIDHQFDTEKFNADMAFQIKKAVASGKWDPNDGDPNQFMLEFQQGSSINPEELGMNRESFQQLIQGMRGGGQQAPMQSNVGGQMQRVLQGMGQQQRPGYGDAFTSQGTMGQLVQPGAQMLDATQQFQQGPPAQFGQPQGGMQRAPQAQPQKGAPATAAKLSKLGQQAMQRLSQKYKPEETQMMVIQRLMQRPYNQSYEQAAARVLGR